VKWQGFIGVHGGISSGLIFRAYFFLIQGIPSLKLETSRFLRPLRFMMYEVGYIARRAVGLKVQTKKISIGLDNVI
jgi:hypothetical protein